MRMALAGLQETVDVVASAPTEIAPNLTVATTYESDALELLPVGRTLRDAALLAPGVTDNGPNDGAARIQLLDRSSLLTARISTL